ncbi:MAG: urate hydroxylase PuuD [Xanthomonadales bacterium]|nr:urate hydroxylase PuuD [Xanthomonadales bacterium]
MNLDAYLLDWLSLLLRWSHFVVGIAWIGSSFYFIWLDARLHRPPVDPEDDGVDGDLWSVHGGGFYHAQKYQVAPPRLPETLHWFKWEAYSTWLTGFALLVVTYYLNAGLYLVDPEINPMSPGAAVSWSLLLLLAGWLAYDLLCRSPLGDAGIAAVGLLLLAGLAFGLSQLFSGRGAFMQMGAMLGTIMAANVLMVIIPGQRKMVDALSRGETPDPGPGLRGKQRSVHNNYLTLPVLFVMLSSHYPMTYTHRWNWLVLLLLFLAGALVRHFFNLRNSGRSRPGLLLAALLVVLGLGAAMAPRVQHMPSGVSESPGQGVSTAVIQAIVNDRCRTCHSAAPTHPTSPVAPKGVRLDTISDINQWADQIHQTTVVTRFMPLANLTTITEEERNLIAVWYASRPIEEASTTPDGNH